MLIITVSSLRIGLEFKTRKKVVKQIYVVKKDGRKNISLDLNSTGKKPINALKTSAIDGKERGKLDPPSAKSERRS